MNYPTRNTVRTLLLNSDNELLLMRIVDKRTRNIDGSWPGPFWVTIGGAIHKGESVITAAIREIYEETGLKENDIIFGPIVWKRELDLVLYGEKCHINEKYIIVRTKNNRVATTKLTHYEKDIVKQLTWFKSEEIGKNKESVYPELLLKYLADILMGIFPNEPIDISPSINP